MSRLLKISIETNLFGGNNLAMTPDEDGCFNILVGATNVYNSSGAKYIHDEKTVLMFSPNSEMIGRVKNGLMKGERNHPMPVAGMNSGDYLKRVYTMSEDNIACEFKDLRLSNTMVNLGDKNTMVYPVHAKIKPCGPHGDALYNSLTDPEKDTAFSVRSITVDTVVDGVTQKSFKYIVNYDWVHAPGIEVAKASMWKAFGLESVEAVSVEISMEDIDNLAKSISDISGLGIESSNAITNELKQMFKSCNGDDCIYKQWQL